MCKAQRYKELIVSVALVLATLTVFWPVRHHEFLKYDDNDYLTENRQVRTGLTAEGVRWAFASKVHGHWHPLTWLSHMTDCQLFGLNPAGHHLVSLLFHIANTLLLFWVLKRLTGDLWQSAFVAAVFSLHPLGVESVAWVSERKNVLSTLFWMLTIWTYVRYSERPGLSRYLLIVAAFIVGLMSKLMLITMPFVLLLLDYWPLGRVLPGKTAAPGRAKIQEGMASRFQRVPVSHLVWEKVPMLALALVFGFITLSIRDVGAAGELTGSHSLKSPISAALVAYLIYMVKMIWPCNLAIPYLSPGTLPGWQVAGSGLVLVSISLLVICKARGHPYLPVGWFWFLGTLVPVIGLVPLGPQLMADRYMYVPMIGLLLVIAWGITDTLARWRHRRIALALSACLVITMSMSLTRRQVAYWRNTMTLFTHTLKVIPGHPLAHNTLGVALADQGRLQEAMGHYQEALRIRPHYAKAHNNLGEALDSLGRYDEAIVHYTRALEVKPDYAETHSNLGIALAGKGRLQEAIGHFQKALRIKPYYAKAHSNLGVALAQQGKMAEAVFHYSRALQIQPDLVGVHSNFGIALAQQGKMADAIRHFKKALQLSPNYVEVHVNLGLALVEQGKMEEAVAHYAAALRIRPDFARAHFSLGLAYLRMGDRETAFREYEILQRINPALAGKLSQEILASLKGAS